MPIASCATSKSGRQPEKHFSRPVVLASALAALLVLAGCQKDAGPVVAHAPLEVKTMTVTTGDEYRWIEALGQAEGVREAEVRAQVSGILQEISYKEGDRVKRGQTLFVIDPQTYRAALNSAVAQREQAKAQLAQDERELARNQKLLAARAISSKEVDDARSSVAVRRAELAAAKAQVETARINLERTQVAAPSDGLVGASEVNTGTLVSASTTLLALITQPEEMRIRFTISERDLAGAAINLNNRVRLMPADGQFIDTTLDYVAGQMDSETASLLMRARVPSSVQGIVPGQFVHVQLQAQLLHNVARVPQDAVFQLPDGGYQVYVVREGKAQPVDVKLGHWAETDWIVTGGLNAGDEVIINNVQRLRRNLPVKVAGSPQTADAAAPAASTP